MYQLSGNNMNHTPHHWYVCLLLRSWSLRCKGSIWSTVAIPTDTQYVALVCQIISTTFW